MFPAINSLTIFLLVLFLSTNKYYILILALFLLLVNTFFGTIANYVNKCLETVSKFLGEIISKGVLILAFYLFLIPIAFLYRSKNRDPLNLSPNSDTLWKRRNMEFSKGDFEKPF